MLRQRSKRSAGCRLQLWCGIVIFVSVFLLVQSQINNFSEENDAYDYYDQMRFSSDVTIEESQAVVNETELQSNVYRVTLNETGETFRLAEIKGFLPFSDGKEQLDGFINMGFAAILAVYHFNNMEKSPILTDGSLVDVMDCNVRLTLELWDTFFSPIEATREFTQECLLQNHTFSNPAATAVVGAFRSSVTLPLAIMTGINGIPQVSPASTAIDFDVKEQFPLFGRTVTNSVGEATVAVELFKSMGSTHVIILFVADAFGSGLQKAFQDAATAANITTASIAFPFDLKPNSPEAWNIRNSIRNLQYRHVYAAFYDVHIDVIFETSNPDEAPITGPEYFYVFPGLDLVTLQQTTTWKANSTRVSVLDGAAILQMQGGIETQPLMSGGTVVTVQNKSSGFGRFTESWREAVNDSNFVQYAKSRLPRSVLDIDGFFFQFGSTPSALSPFVYDAVTALSISMCKAGELSEFFTGADIFDEFRNLTFDGSSGVVEIDPDTGTRNYTTISFVTWNVRFKQVDNGGYAVFKFVPAFQFDGSAWEKIDANEFLFADKSTTPPSSLPAISFDYNYIGDPARIIGCLLVGGTIFSAFFFSGWAFFYRGEDIVRASQPTFLHLISAGAVVIISTIIPLSLEETVVNSTHGLDLACMSIPWLYIVGTNIAFCGLFTKVHAVYQAYRDPELDVIYITACDMFVTFLKLFSVNFVVLLSWTLVSPLEWTRITDPSFDSFGRPTSSYAVCSSSHSLPFAIIAALWNVGILIVFTFCAYKARNIETEYFESQYIGVCLAAVLQAWAMGLPIVIVVWDAPQARFFVLSGIVYVTSCVMMYIIFAPKVIALRAEKISPRATNTNAYGHYLVRSQKFNLSSSNYRHQNDAVRTSTLLSSEERKEEEPTDRQDESEPVGEEKEDTEQSTSNEMEKVEIIDPSHERSKVATIDPSQESATKEKSPEVVEEEDPLARRERTRMLLESRSEELPKTESGWSFRVPGGSSKTWSTFRSSRSFRMSNISDSNSMRNLSSLRRLGAYNSNEIERNVGGLRITHNPRTTENLLLSGGVELTKEELRILKEQQIADMQGMTHELHNVDEDDEGSHHLVINESNIASNGVHVLEPAILEEPEDPSSLRLQEMAHDEN